MRPLQPAQRVLDDAGRGLARLEGIGRRGGADPHVVDVEEEAAHVARRCRELRGVDLRRELRRAAAAAHLELVDQVGGERRAQVCLNGIAV